MPVSWRRQPQRVHKPLVPMEKIKASKSLQKLSLFDNFM
jgi:hypothetical protein